MKLQLIAIACALVLSAGVYSATENKSEATNQDHSHSWHCTAYDPHGHGYSYSDEHYEHAYHGAQESCEHSSGHHCHDVHCHQH